MRTSKAILAGPLLCAALCLAYACGGKVATLPEIPVQTSDAGIDSVQHCGLFHGLTIHGSGGRETWLRDTAARSAAGHRWQAAAPRGGTGVTVCKRRIGRAGAGGRRAAREFALCLVRARSKGLPPSIVPAHPIPQSDEAPAGPGARWC